MPISPGTKVGPYEIQALLGAGGMGEVYRARDTRLGRDVAIKVLPTEYSNDSDRLRRFEQEARATASLSDPNILAVFDVGEEKGQPYIVSELLQGETLRTRLKAGAMPLRRTIEYALQIARGLAAAHSRGVLHRDLKPENIFVMRNGQVKILDFGLAKLTQPEPVAGGISSTVDFVTAKGELLGTLGYMSPEQTRGANVDLRSDLFSFGAVLYEMVGGRSAFRGATLADTVSAILKDHPPDLSTTTEGVPPLLEGIVRHCLEKEPADRFQSAGDVAFALESLLNISATHASSSLAPAKRRSWLFPALGLGVLLLGLGAWFAVRMASTPRSAPIYTPLTFARESMSSARFTPDYHTVIYSSARVGGEYELFSVTPESLAPVSLGFKSTDVESISRSGEMLLVQDRKQLGAFTRVGTLARAPLAGGAPRPILTDVQDADWGPDNQIAVARFQDGRFRLEYPAGHLLYQTDGYVSDVRVSPNGDLVAFADHPTFGDNSGTIAVVNSSGHKRTLGSAESGILGLAWDPTGKKIWFSAIGSGVRAELKIDDLSGHTRVVASIPGSLVIQDIASDGTVLVRHENVRINAMAMGSGESQERDLTIRDWTLVDDVSPDGSRVLLEEQGTGSQTGDDLYVRPMDGSAPVRLGHGEGMAFSPDGKWVLAGELLQHPSPLTMIPLGPGEPRQITQDSIDHVDARFLPGGNAIAFTGIEPGHKPRIYTQTIGSKTSVAISGEGVRGAIPTADGKFVFGFSDRVSLYPADGQGEPREVAGIHPDEAIAAVLSDGRRVLIEDVVQNTSMNIFLVDLASGKRELFKKIGPTDLAGVYMFPGSRFTRDGKYYAYAYTRALSQLFLVKGLP